MFTILSIIFALFLSLTLGDETLYRVPAPYDYEQVSKLFDQIGYKELDGVNFEETKRELVKNQKFITSYSVEVRGTSYDNCSIVLTNQIGGRSWMFVRKPPVTRLIFKNDNERKRLGPWCEKYFMGKLSAYEEANLLMVLGLSNAFNIYLNPDGDDPKLRIQRTLASYLGDFVLDENTQDFVLSVGFTKNDAAVNSQCLRSIASVVCEIDAEEAAKLIKKIESLIKTRKGGSILDSDEALVMETLRTRSALGKK